ncbi:hypothetical protein SAMN05880558_12415 [Aeromonas sp. RU39B]|uniref:hypothetical protein n=1 Tax=Aeromonas sp. RU39B TaxID=1907416 RepID=UPI0009558F20|nr:hypothetical protein [Aeromonas sp. RU39B]SIR65714.1 hypothetical protein SAMN05880558_12415 [Aeromonas sp. RU39B]
MTQLTAGEVANAAASAMIPQLDAAIKAASDITRPMLDALRAQLIGNTEAIIAASNAMLDDEDALHDQRNASALELTQLKAEHDELRIQCSRLIAARREDEAKVRKIESAHSQMAHQRDAYKRDAEEGRRIKAELDKAKARLKRLEESGQKREAEHNELKMKLQRTESMLVRATKAVVYAKDSVNNTQHRMMIEGLLVEKVIEVKGVHYYLYRRPCVVAETFRPTDDTVVSRDHMYAYRVETSAGYHWDAIPTQDGTIGTVKHRTMPKEVRQYLADKYSESALFDTGKVTLKNMELTQDMDSLAIALAELDAIDHSLTPLKIKDSLKQTRARKVQQIGRKAA